MPIARRFFGGLRDRSGVRVTGRLVGHESGQPAVQHSGSTIGQHSGCNVGPRLGQRIGQTIDPFAECGGYIWFHCWSRCWLQDWWNDRCDMLLKEMGAGYFMCDSHPHMLFWSPGRRDGEGHECYLCHIVAKQNPIIFVWELDDGYIDLSENHPIRKAIPQIASVKLL